MNIMVYLKLFEDYAHNRRKSEPLIQEPPHPNDPEPWLAEAENVIIARVNAK